MHSCDPIPPVALQSVGKVLQGKLKALATILMRETSAPSKDRFPRIERVKGFEAHPAA